MSQIRVSKFAFALFVSGPWISEIYAQNRVIDTSAMQIYEARVTSLTGQVSRLRDKQVWALSTGERVPIQQLIVTGPDGYAHFDVAGGSSFEVLGNSRVVFRPNASNSGDLLELVAGRVRIHVHPGIGQWQFRIFCPVAIVSTNQTATVALALDEDDNARVDVIEGEVHVQHAFLPRSEPVIVRAIDAILVQKDQQISRRMERGSLYRYTLKPLKDAWSALTFGHSGAHGSQAEYSNKLLAQSAQQLVVDPNTSLQSPLQ